LDLGPVTFVPVRRVIIDPANLLTTLLIGPLGFLGVHIHGVHAHFLARSQVLFAGIPSMLLTFGPFSIIISLIDFLPPLNALIRRLPLATKRIVPLRPLGVHVHGVHTALLAGG
jgi:hypothetical protein